MNQENTAIEGMEYNSVRKDLIIPEYGRNIQKMVDFALSVEDREERNTIVRAIISVMGQLFPQLRDIEDFKHKLWDHLHIMSDFQLDVDSPYPKPAREDVVSKPERVPYPQKDIRHGHYGYALEEMIRVAAKMEDGPEKDELTVLTANMMKKNYATWNLKSISDDAILQQLKKLSGGKLTLPEGTELIATSKIVKNKTHQHRNQNQGKKKRPQRRKY